MRIQDVYGAGSTEAAQAAATQAGKAQAAEAVASKGELKGAAAAGAPESDQVQLSDLTGQLSRLLGVGQPERSARIERLAAAVQAGQYQVDAAQLSRRLVDETLRGG